MEWPFIVALVIAIPVILLVPFLVWLVVTSGLYQVFVDVRRRSAARRKLATARMAEENARRAV